MPRSIDANKACRIIEQLFCGDCRSYTHCENCPYNNVLMLLRNLPTIDAVRHGHWIKANDPMSSPFDTMKRCLCSECREWGRVTSYCPNCGARMDEEEEDAEIH